MSNDKQNLNQSSVKIHPNQGKNAAAIALHKEKMLAKANADTEKNMNFRLNRLTRMEEITSKKLDKIRSDKAKVQAEITTFKSKQVTPVVNN